MLETVGRFVLMYMSDPTAALQQIAERIRPGGVVAFHEVDARGTAAPAMSHSVLASLQGILVRTFERYGARLDIGTELYSRMLDASLEPNPKPLVEIAVLMGHCHVAPP